MSHDELKKDFQKCVERAAGHRHVVDVFGDMVRAMAIAIESPFTIGERNEELEREYAAIKARYTAAEFQEFPKALAITGAAIELKREDFLGHALEALGASNTRNGQFLTPVCVSRMMAVRSVGSSSKLSTAMPWAESRGWNERIIRMATRIRFMVW